MVKVLSRDAVQRMTGRRSSSAVNIGGGGGDASGVSRAWVDENYISKNFFNQLFTIHGTRTYIDEETEQEVTEEVVITPNGIADGEEYKLSNVEVSVGLWTKQFLSALGLNPGGGGGGGATALKELVDVTISNPQNGQALVYAYDSVTGQGKWVNDNVTPDLTDYATKQWVQQGYLPLSGGTMTGSLRTKYLFEVYNGTAASKQSAYMKFIRNGAGGDDYAAIGWNGSNVRLTLMGGDGNYTSEHDALLIGYNGQLKLQAPNGTAPITTSSTTLVTNLNADMLDGRHGDGYAMIGTLGTRIEQETDLNDILHAGTYTCISGADALTLVNTPTGGNFRLWHIVNTGTDGSASGQWSSQIILAPNEARMFIRSHSGYSFGSWKEFAYLTSNVASATKLQTPRTIWGQNFDGTGNVSGAITGATTISASSNVSVGGTLGVTGATTLSSTLGVTGLLTANGGINIPSGKTLTIGDAVLSWDSTNQGIKITKGLYSETFISALGANSSGGGGGGGGSVTSVAMSVPTGFSISGSPITSSGTLALSFAAGYSLPTTAKQSQWDAKQDAISDLATIRSNAAHGETAYNWGNHANAGYATQTWVQQGYLPLKGGTMANTNLVTNLNADMLGGQHGSYYAAASSLNNYLPLSGGVMTGNISFKGSGSTYQMIKFKSSDDAYGQGLVLGGGGLVSIGGGESQDVMAAQSDGSAERMMIGNDGEIEIYSNLQNGWDSRHSLIFNTNGMLTMDGGQLKAYQLLVTNGSSTSNYWHKLGTFVTAGNSHNLIINIYSGDGYNGETRQNSYVRIIIKDGWQNSPSITNCLGITCERYGNASQIQVRVNVTNRQNNNSATGDVWVLLPWDYANGNYTIEGDFASWNHNSSASGDTTTPPTHNQREVMYLDNAYLTSNVASATKLQTPRTIFGQSFDGTGNVSGAITGATTISASGNVSVGGTLGVTGATTLSSTLGVAGLITANGGINIPSGKTLTIGDAVLSWDGTNQGIKITKGLYSETFISALGANSSGGGGGGGGSVTSVAMNVPTGFSISGSPITTSGTLALSFASGYSLPTTAKQTQWDAKQDAISDLATIRSNASHGETAYNWGNHANAGYATQQWVQQQGYITSSALTGYATQQWVQQGYVTIETAQTVSGNKTFSGTITPTGGIVPRATGSVNTHNAADNSKLVIKQASQTVDGTPNNGLVLEWGTSDKWVGQLYFGDNGTQGLYWAGWTSPNNVLTRNEWVKLAFVTDNVASATKLQTARTIWGQNFDGTANVSGDITDAGNIFAKGDYLLLSSGKSKYGLMVESTSWGENRNCAFGFHAATSGHDIAWSTRSGSNDICLDLIIDPNNTVAKRYTRVYDALRIGDGMIVWDSANNALKVIKINGDAANFYATGGVSALGYSS